LHSHVLPAPMSKMNNEVSCYGNATTGDSNDYWVLETVDDMIRGSKSRFSRIHSLTTRLRIRHLNTGCYLRAGGSSLPAWGFKQVEVSCDKVNRPKDEHSYWNVESHWNDKRGFSLYSSRRLIAAQSRPATPSCTARPSSATSGTLMSP
jgi:dolichyl-phosphate-mannose-protein mannosyltransferase